MSRGRRALGALVVGASLVAVGCAGGTGTEVRGSGQTRPVDDRAAVAAAEPLLGLAVRLEQQLAGARPGADLAVAPLPVANGLAQVRAGAGGATAAELDRVLGVPDAVGAAVLADGLSSLGRTLTARSGEQRDAYGRTGSVSVELVQVLWLQRGTTLEAAWLDALQTTWGAGVRTADFRSDPETARRAVNGWVSDATNGHIDQLAPRGSIGDETRLLAAGAGYLKAPFVTPFDRSLTRLEPFRTIDGSTPLVSMMRAPDLADARVGRGDDWVAVDLPYLGRDLWLTVILPDEGRFTEVASGLDGPRLAELLRSLEPATVDLSLPEFGFTTDVPLTDALRGLGLDTALDPFEADQSGISTEPLALSAVLHQTYLAVDEQGTEATATSPRRSTTTSTTSIPATTPATPASTPTPPTPAAGPPPAVVVDRPFLVLVRDRPTGAPLFYGRVLDPTT